MKHVVGTVLLLALSIVPSAFGQPADYIVVEGHIFDAKTLKPLQNVSVFVSETRQSGTFAGGGIERSDANGYYYVPVLPNNNPDDPNVSAVLGVTCINARGRADSVTFLPLPLRSTVPYRRDIYLSLPKNSSTCLATTGQ